MAKRPMSEKARAKLIREAQDRNRKVESSAPRTDHMSHQRPNGGTDHFQPNFAREKPLKPGTDLSRPQPLPTQRSSDTRAASPATTVTTNAHRGGSHVVPGTEGTGNVPLHAGSIVRVPPATKAAVEQMRAQRDAAAKPPELMPHVTRAHLENDVRLMELDMAGRDRRAAAYEAKLKDGKLTDFERRTTEDNLKSVRDRNAMGEKYIALKREQMKTFDGHPSTTPYSSIAAGGAPGPSAPSRPASSTSQERADALSSFEKGQVATAIRMADGKMGRGNVLQGQQHLEQVAKNLGTTVTRLRDHASTGMWDESQHPRDDQGKFTNA